MKFSEIIGNAEEKEYLAKSVKDNSFSQSYLFVGTEGIGKLLIAKEFAKKILCLENGEDNCLCKSCKCFDGDNHTDYKLINEQGETIKIEQIRELTNHVIERPIISERKVYIINDSDKMTKEAQNCLLKTLEEPPEFVVIILITANENAILNTIHSRCMTVKFKNIANADLQKYAMQTLGYEKITENLLNSFGGSIGKATMQLENQELFMQVENWMNHLDNCDQIDALNEAKKICDKENMDKILEYMMICMYAKRSENPRYINCIEIIEECFGRLKRNCNFDMSIDKMVWEIWECLHR